MVIVLKRDASIGEIAGVVSAIEETGHKAHVSRGEERTVVGIAGESKSLDKDLFLSLSGVEDVVPTLRPFKLVSREFHPDDTIVKVGGVRIGKGTFVVMAGPCAIESKEVTFETAKFVSEHGGHILRGGAFKPRTSPYSFQGLGKEGLEYLAEAGKKYGLPVVTEVVTPEDVPLVEQYADILQIGARNMQNFRLLTVAGKSRRPVLLKRGLMSTIEELLLAAEYIVAEGNSNLILCERGIRTFERYTRNTLDIAAVPLLKQLTHLPVIVDPSHATGDRSLVLPLAMAGLAAGADGTIIEVHPEPEKAKSDSAQTIYFSQFEKLMKDLEKISGPLGRSLGQRPRERV